MAFHWAFCIFWGMKSAQKAVTSSDFFVAGRSLPIWPFVLGATASSFAAWMFIWQPGLVFRDGFQGSYLSFIAIAAPLGSALFFKRQWMLSKRYGFITPGEMYAAYFQTNIVRIFTAILAVVFAVPFLGLLFSASGYIFSIVTNGALSHVASMWFLTLILLIYVGAGGLRAVAYVCTVQTLLMVVAALILGFAVLDLIGGFEVLNEALAKVAELNIGTWGTTLGFGGGDYSSWFATPGVIQWASGLDKEGPVGGIWTGVMVLSTIIAFMGLQATPVFSMWAFSSRSPRAFAPQQVWASACVVGVLLFFFTTIEGVGAQLLGASKEVNDAGLALKQVLNELGSAQHNRITPDIINLVGQSAPWLLGILTVSVLAAIKATGGAYLSTAGSVFTRDIYRFYFNKNAAHQTQIRCSRITMLIISTLALLMATFANNGMILLGGLAISLGLQLVPALLAVTWIPWFTSKGVSAGLIIGCLGAIFTEAIAQVLSDTTMPWGQWPWTIHAAAWGFVANIVICIIGSAMTQSEEETEHKKPFHRFLRDHAVLSATKSRYRTLAWLAALVWVFFAIGPGMVIGNYLFGAPGSGYANWSLAMPSIWAWQIIWWGIGVLLIWLLAYRMGMSTEPTNEVVPIADDIASSLPALRR